MNYFLKIIVWGVTVFLIGCFILYGLVVPRLVPTSSKTTETTRLLYYIQKTAQETRNSAMIRFDSASKDTDNVFVREKILRVAQRNAFGGAIHIGTIGKNKHIVHVTFKGIPFYPCTKLFIAMVETGKVEAIIINDMRTDKTSINPKQAMRACSQKANTMRWMILN